MQATDTKYRDIVLIGGGHAHALVVKMWGMKPLAGVRLTLISESVDTPYSGMLPGLVSGQYCVEQTHIDLFKLCSWANVRFICARVTGLQLVNKHILLEQRPVIEYDLVSIDTGSTPNIQRTPGAAEHATAVKPISQFYKKWQQLQYAMRDANHPLNIALVGAGAGGFELICAMHAWQQKQHDSKTLQPHKFHWIISGDKPLSGHNSKVQELALAHCQDMGIEVHLNFKVAQVSAQQIISQSATSNKASIKLNVDAVIWCTAANPAQWPATAGLALDDQGFIAIDDYLRSHSHPDVFAAGDVATQTRSPRPKAGVFAVRQAPILFENLRRAILQQPLKEHRPQRQFLSLLATGNQRAIASKGRMYFSGAWVWKLKDYIDQSFMQKLNDLPEKPSMSAQQCDHILLDDQDSIDKMRCGGCGAKVASSILSKTLKQVTADIPPHSRDDIIIGLESPDDAAVVSTSGKALVQSVDQFRSIIDDPYIFAKIATTHALSDLHAMACDPQSALSIVAMPFAGSKIQQRELYQLSYGVIEELNAAGCTLTGGHTSEASELSLGLAVNGLIDVQDIKTKTGVSANQQLILTKPLGTGVIMAAHMQAIAKGAEVQACLQSMLHSNQQAASILKEHQSTAMTDLTGFGLIGHLLEMLRHSDLVCHLKLSAIPLIEGAARLSAQGISSSLYEKNHEASLSIIDREKWQQHSQYPLLFDPQTSGGLLAWVDADKTAQCLTALKQAGFSSATIIAYAGDKSPPESSKNIYLEE